MSSLIYKLRISSYPRQGFKRKSPQIAFGDYGTTSIRSTGLPTKRWVLDTLFSDLSTHWTGVPQMWRIHWHPTLPSVWVCSYTTYTFSTLLSCQVSHLKGQSFPICSLSKIPCLLPNWCLYQGISSHLEKKKKAFSVVQRNPLSPLDKKREIEMY